MTSTELNTVHLNITLEVSEGMFDEAMSKLFQWPNDHAGRDNMVNLLQWGAWDDDKCVYQQPRGLLGNAILEAIKKARPEIIADLEQIEKSKGSEEAKVIQQKYYKG